MPLCRFTYSSPENSFLFEFQVFCGALELEYRVNRKKIYKRKWTILSKHSIDCANFDDMQQKTQIKLSDMVLLISANEVVYRFVNYVWWAGISSLQVRGW